MIDLIHVTPLEDVPLVEVLTVLGHHVARPEHRLEQEQCESPESDQSFCLCGAQERGRWGQEEVAENIRCDGLRLLDPVLKQAL